MRARFGSRRFRLVVAVAGVFVLGGGSALAYFTSKGGGSASASVGSAQNVTITPGTPTAQLYPGASGDVVATISNPNSIPVRVNSLVLDTSQGTNGFDASGEIGPCSSPALSFTTQTNGGSGWTIPKKVGPTSGTLPVTLTNAVSMGTTADNGCQGATFTVYLKTGP